MSVGGGEVGFKQARIKFTRPVYYTSTELRFVNTAALLASYRLHKLLSAHRYGFSQVRSMLAVQHRQDHPLYTLKPPLCTVLCTIRLKTQTASYATTSYRTALRPEL